MYKKEEESVPHNKRIYLSDLRATASERLENSWIPEIN